MVKVRRSYGFLNGIDVSFYGTKGGLSFGWKQDCAVVLRSFSNSHIDVLIKDDSNGNCL